MFGWILGFGVAAVVLLVLWPKLKSIPPFSYIVGTAATTIGTASDAVTDAVTQAAFTTLAAAGWANGDIEFIAALADCREMQRQWNKTPVVVTPTVEALAAEVASLKATVASQTTATIPNGAVAKG